jgi:hypothetical protein
MKGVIIQIPIRHEIKLNNSINNPIMMNTETGTSHHNYGNQTLYTFDTLPLKF